MAGSALHLIELCEAEGKLRSILALVKNGAEVVLTEGDTPLARLVPVSPAPASRRVPGLHRGTIWMSDDFDAPLPEELFTGGR